MQCVQFDMFLCGEGLSIASRTVCGVYHRVLMLTMMSLFMYALRAFFLNLNYSLTADDDNG